MSQFVKSQGTRTQVFPEIRRAKHSDVCICCLDRDISFVRLASCKHTGFIASFFKYAHPESVVCYRCHKMLENIDVFKRQVKESLRILIEKTPVIRSNKKLYCLQKSKVDITTINPEQIDTSSKFFTFGSHRTFCDDLQSTDSTISVYEHQEDSDEFHDIDNALPLSVIKKEDIASDINASNRTSGDESETTGSTITVKIEQCQGDLIETHSTKEACPPSVTRKELDKVTNFLNVSSLSAQIRNVQNSHTEHYESLSRVRNSHNYYSSMQVKCVQNKSICPETNCTSVPRISHLQDYRSLSMLLKHVPVEPIRQNINQLPSTQVTKTQNKCQSSSKSTLPVKDTSQPNNQFPPMKLNVNNVHKSTSEVIFLENNQSSSTQVSKILNNSQSSANLKVLDISLYTDDLPNLYINKCKGKIKKVALTMEEVLEERESRRSKDKYLIMTYKCENCITGFEIEEKYLEHNMKKHAKSDGVVCGICKCVYANINKFKQHAEIHFIKYQCVECGERRQRLPKLIRHYNERHGVIDLQFRCTKCRFSTPSAHAFKNHNEMHENQPTCPHCGKTFTNNNSLKTHIRNQHDQLETMERFSCNQCSKTYKNASTLRSHKRSVHRPADTSAYCTTCQMQFGSRAIFQSHLNAHSNHVEKRYTCDYCGARFLVKVSVREHILRMHLKVARALHKCVLCDKVFTSSGEMRRHKEYVHDKKRPPRDKICHHCGKGFTSNQMLKTHIRTHTGERPLLCPFCPATFAHNAALYNHKILKHKVKPVKAVAETSGKKLSNTIKRKKTRALTHAKRNCNLNSSEKKL